MKIKVVNARFNNLPIEHRTTIIGNELAMEIKWLQREKTEDKKQYVANQKRLNDRIVILERHLKELKD